MAETNLVGFDPSKYAEAIRSKIQAEVVGLIPDEQWAQMITAEIKRFVEPRTVNEYGKITTTESPMQALIRVTLEAKFKDMLAKDLDSILQTTWENGQHQKSELLKKLAVEAAPDILSELMTSFVEHAVQALRSHNRF